MSNAFRVLVLKTDRVYAETLCLLAAHHLPAAHIQLAHSLAAAKAELQLDACDLLISGSSFPDGDLFDLLDNALVQQRSALRILVVTTRHDVRWLTALFRRRTVGLFDPSQECRSALEAAIRATIAGSRYWTPGAAERVAMNCGSAAQLCRHLTAREQRMLTEVGDGSDDAEVAARLGLKESTVTSARRDLHRKLHVQHRGTLMRFAIQYGFVRITPEGVQRPTYAVVDKR